MDKNFTPNYSNLTIELINELFQLFFGVFPSTFSILKNIEDINNAKYFWAKGLFTIGKIDEKGDIDLEFIQRGVNKIYKLNQTFMPSLGEFINLCELHENNNL
jgi:hypothetical protein